MKCEAYLKDINLDYRTKRTQATLEVLTAPENVEKYSGKHLSVEIKEYKDHRSDAANRLMWHCLELLAIAEHSTKWDEYLEALWKYGKSTYVSVAEEAVEDFKSLWRECRVVEKQEINGKTYVKMLCCYGSSTYDTAEFARLLDGVISELDSDELENLHDERDRAIALLEGCYGTMEKDSRI